MRALLLTLSLAMLLGLTACNDRKYFIPNVVYSPTDAILVDGRAVLKITRDGITFKNGEFVTKSGKGDTVLPAGFHYVNQSSRYIIAANDSSDVIVLSRGHGTMVKKLTLSYPLVSAKIYGRRIIYMLENDMFGMYDFKASKKQVEIKVGEAYAIDNRVTNPLVLNGGNTMAVPSLDGKILLINPKNPHGAQSISIGTENVFNNVIYLDKIADRRIIAATPRKLISFKKGSNHKYEAQIADVDITGSTVYAATQDGRILKLSSTLKVLAEKKFDYAEFLSIGVVGNRVYAVDKQGAVVVLDRKLSRSSVYKIDKVKSYTFISGSRLYIDRKVIILPKLPL